MRECRAASQGQRARAVPADVHAVPILIKGGAVSQGDRSDGGPRAIGRKDGPATGIDGAGVHVDGAGALMADPELRAVEHPARSDIDGALRNGVITGNANLAASTGDHRVVGDVQSSRRHPVPTDDEAVGGQNRPGTVHCRHAHAVIILTEREPAKISVERTAGSDIHRPIPPAGADPEEVAATASERRDRTAVHVDCSHSRNPGVPSISDADAVADRKARGGVDVHGACASMSDVIPTSHFENIRIGGRVVRVVGDRQRTRGFFADVSAPASLIEVRAVIDQDRSDRSRIHADARPPTVVDHATVGHIDIGGGAILPANQEVAGVHGQMIENRTVRDIQGRTLRDVAGVAAQRGPAVDIHDGPRPADVDQAR